MGSYRPIERGTSMKKKMIPIIAVVVLIIIVILFTLLGRLIEKYTPSKERQELSEYYQLSSEDDVAVILNHDVLDVKGKWIDGNVYLDFDTVHDLINERFFWDSNENKLLYATATDLISADAESASYLVTRDARQLDHIVVKVTSDNAYIAADFVKLYSDVSYEVYTDPARIVITNQWGDYTTAPLKKNTELRYQGGIKSPILADVEKGAELTVLEPDETWTKVMTDNGIIGYVKSKTLGAVSTKSAVSSYVPESFSHISRDFKINLGWHQVTNTSANGNVASVLQGTNVNVISPTWFYLSDTNGNIGSLASSSYVDYCHQNGIEVWALVSNFGAKDQGMENPDLAQVLTYTSHRENLVNNLISMAIQYNLDGINVDFESIDPSTVGEAFIQFIRELSLKCANNGIVLSVDNYSPTDYTAFYDREEQALFADYVILMGYDEHYSGSDEAGSVASIGFVSEGIANTLKEVPADQLILGMPFYTRVWSETPISSDDTAPAEDPASSEQETTLSDVDTIPFELDCYSAGMREAQNLVTANGATPVWLEDVGQYYVEYLNNGVTYKIWLEDGTSLEEKLKLMQENQLAGGAFWKLGLEDPSVWNVIIRYIN